MDELINFLNPIRENTATVEILLYMILSLLLVIWGKKLIVYEYLCIQKLTIFFFLTFCKV